MVIFSTNHIMCGGCQVMILNFWNALEWFQFFTNICWIKRESCVQPYNLWSHKICLYSQKCTFFLNDTYVSDQLTDH